VPTTAAVTQSAPKAILFILFIVGHAEEEARGFSPRSGASSS
jgi:hypothetical protein